MKNKYDKSKHDNYITCNSCKSRNAPQDSKDYKPYCYDCGVKLDTQAPVDIGDIVELYIDDIHQKGDGVGRTEEGFVVLVPGAITGDCVRAKIKNISGTYAEAELLEKGVEIPDHAKKYMEDDKGDEDKKYRPGNFFGDT